MKTEKRFISDLYKSYLLSSMLALFGGAIGQIAGNIVAGNIVGSGALSVTSFVTPIYYVFATMGGLIGVGGSTVCASLMGKREFYRTRQTFTSCLILLGVSFVVLGALLLIFLSPILRALGVPDEVFPQVYDYALITVIGGIFIEAQYIAFNFLRLDGKNIQSVILFVGMGVINVLLDFLFLQYLNMGVAGIALANVLSYGISTTWGIAVLCKKSRTFKPVKLLFKDVRDNSKEVFLIGSQGAAENICILLKAAIMNALIMWLFGQLAVSAYSVTGSLYSFCTILLYGASGTVPPFVGVFGAERDYRSIRNILGTAFLIGGVLVLIFTAISLAMPGTLATLFGMTDAAELAVAIPAIRLFSLSFLPCLINLVMIYYHMASGRIAVANVMTVLKFFGLPVTLAVLFGAIFGVNGLFAGLAAGEWAALAVMALIHLVKKLRSKSLAYLTLLDEESEKRVVDYTCGVENSPEAAAACVAQIEEFFDGQESISMKRRMLITLASEEILGLILEHSIKGYKAMIVSIRIVVREELVIMRFRNAGELFNPIDYYKTKQSELNLDSDDKLGKLLGLDDSLGIKMVIDTADTVDYRQTFGINNLTVIL